MKTDYLTLEYSQLLWLILLLGPPLILSWFFELGQNKQILWASLRMTLQLLAIGALLHWIFAMEHWSLVMAYVAAMTAIAGYTASKRTDCGYRGLVLDALTSIAASAWFVGAFALFLIIKPSPWYSPQYVIPLVGMILGNTLNGFTLGMNRFLESCRDHRTEIEATLAMGGSRWEAARPWFSRALSMGLIPIVNTMMISGLVSLPGMMTGQILGGVSPLEAVKYQVVIMILILSSTCLGTMLMLMRGFHRLFTPEHRFLFDRLGRG